MELKTNSKMFCGCKNDPFHAPKPNIYTCPVCLGLPGALPVPNKKAIESVVMLGLGLGCRINKESRFDRKHYFYPDLPKGYQISQYEKPFCEKGKINIGKIGEVGGTWEIRIRRVHLEEDTGKLLHRKINGEEVSLIDFNRSGVPLVEIVTEPDIRSAEEAKEVAKKIHSIVRALEISDANMEKGSMRLEANVSLSVISSEERRDESRDPAKRLGSIPPQWDLDPSTSLGMTSGGRDLHLPSYKVEIKNINSFRFLERAITEEIERQKEILESGKQVKQETRGWDTQSMTSKSQRTKEEAADYRYFPEPDIPPIRLTDRWISELKNQISDLPDEVFEKLIQAGISDQAAEVISGNKAMAEAVERGIRGIRGAREKRGKIGEIGEIREFGNWIIHHQGLAEKISGEELVEMFRKEKAEVVGDEGQLNKWAEAVVGENQKAVEDYRNGKEAALQFLIGQVQRLAKGKADVNKVATLLNSKLKSQNSKSSVKLKAK